jgi:hypothetical protein
MVLHTGASRISRDSGTTHTQHLLLSLHFALPPAARCRTDNEKKYIRLFDAYYKEQEIRTNLHLFSELQLIDLLNIAAPSLRRLEVTCQYHIGQYMRGTDHTNQKYSKQNMVNLGNHIVPSRLAEFL